MGLSDCACGGTIALGPDASNTCDRCGKGFWGTREPGAPNHRDAGLPAHIEYIFFVYQKADCAPIKASEYTPADLRAIADHMDRTASESGKEDGRG